MLKYLIALLFSWVTFTAPVGAPPFNPEVEIRERWTTPINMEAVSDSFIVINFFKDARYIGIVTDHEDGLYWSGYLRAKPNSFFVLYCDSGYCWIRATSQEGCYMAYGWGDYFRIIQWKDSEPGC
jgi:hypothetical protein